MHGPENISVGYNRFDKVQQVAVTFFDYKPKMNLDELYKKEKEVLGRYKQNLQTLFEDQKILSKNKKTFSYKIMGFSANENFAQQTQKVYSELILINGGEKYIKVRMTTPFAQKDQSSKLTLDLINKIKWD